MVPHARHFSTHKVAARDWEFWVVFGYTGGLKGPHQILSHKNTKGGSVFILPAGTPFLGANSETVVTLLGPLA